MAIKNPAAQAYKASSILSAPRLKIVQMLYEKTISNLRQSIRLIEEGDSGKFASSILNAQAIVTELFSALNHDGEAEELAGNLADLYQYSTAKLADAHLNKSVASINEVLKILSTLQEGWNSIKES